MWRIPYLAVAAGLLAFWLWGLAGHDVKSSGGYDLDSTVARVGLPLMAFGILAALVIVSLMQRRRSERNEP